MKNFKRFTVICLTLLLCNSCSSEKPEFINESNVKQLQNEKEIATINNLLENIKPQLNERAKDLEEFNYISFEVVKNLNTNEITLENFKELSLFPIADLTQNNRSTYTISCDNNGDGESDWEEQCSGIGSCGKLVKKCLDEGGCAEICENKSLEGQAYASVEIIFIPGKK